MPLASISSSAPQRVAEVTRLFRGLQGLRMVPLGAFLAAWGVLPYAAIGEPWADVLVLAGLVAAVVAERVIGRHYEQRFGAVDRMPSAASLLAGAAWFIALLAAALWMGFRDLPFNPLFVVLGVGMLFHWRPRYGLRVHYAVAGALVLLASLYAPASAAEVAALWSPTTVIIGVLLVVLGVLDHRELARTLGPLDDEDARDEDTSDGEAAYA